MECGVWPVVVVVFPPSLSVCLGQHRARGRLRATDRKLRLEPFSS